jgi:hypothetical protein
MPIAVLLEGASKNEFIIAVEDFFKYTYYCISPSGPLGPFSRPAE